MQCSGIGDGMRFNGMGCLYNLLTALPNNKPTMRSLGLCRKRAIGVERALYQQSNTVTA
jgi:hypothetical protein